MRIAYKGSLVKFVIHLKIQIKGESSVQKSNYSDNKYNDSYLLECIRGWNNFCQENMAFLYLLHRAGAFQEVALGGVRQEPCFMVRNCSIHGNTPVDPSQILQLFNKLL